MRKYLLKFFLGNSNDIAFLSKTIARELVVPASNDKIYFDIFNRFIVQNNEQYYF
ncbi:hypothetical protein LWM68_46255 [Niabella sp. W65]|nr:hypothetical protein [Niabella sp. W65]MCH7369487.1 hypothetical protein [Niabella sp. W65]